LQPEVERWISLNKQSCWWRSATFRQASGLLQRNLLIQMGKYFPDHNRVFPAIAPALFYLRPSMGSYLPHPCGRILATIRITPPLSLQVSICPRAPPLDAAHQFTLSIAKTRFSRFAQDGMYAGFAGAKTGH